jgi:hypothetical protein
MNEQIDGIEFSPIFRKDTLDDFKDVCRSNCEDFLRLFKLSSEISNYLSQKVQTGDNSSKEYYTHLFNIRIRDHYSSSIILISQGFIVDAISLTRSSLEDLLVIINFYITKKFFNQWSRNKGDFIIKPGNLRNNIKNNQLFETRDSEFFDNVYGTLSDIVHPKKNSIMLMGSYHPSLRRLDKSELIRYTDLIVLSFYTYQYQLCEFMKKIYPDDATDLDLIKHKLNNDIKIKSLINAFDI